MIGKVARDALFLDKFKAVQLPYADIAIAILVGFVVAAYVRLGRNISLRNLLVGSVVFLFGQFFSFVDDLFSSIVAHCH